MPRPIPGEFWACFRSTRRRLCSSEDSSEMSGRGLGRTSSLSFVRIASNSLSKAVFQDMKVSQHKRALIEKAFGWMKQTGGMRKTKFRGLAKVGWQFLMTAAAFNLWRLPKIQAA